MNLMRMLLDWLDPPTPPAADADARHAANERETVARLRTDLHARRADRAISAARTEDADLKRRLAALSAQTNVEGRRPWAG